MSKWIHIKDKLPKRGKQIIARGYEKLYGVEDISLVYEEGFRSSVDKKKRMRKGEFVDFYFIVTGWMYVK